MILLILLAVLTVAFYFTSDAVIRCVASVSRRIFILIFSDKSVQKALFDPLNESMQTTMIKTMGPALVETNRNQEVIESMPDVMLSPKMRSTLHEMLISLLKRDEFVAAFIRLMSGVMNDADFHKAITSCLAASLNDAAIRRAAIHLLIEALQDEELHSNIMRSALLVLTEGLDLISRDEKLKTALKESVLESLRDDELHRAAMEGAMGAIKAGIKEALLDPELRDVFKSVLKESLQDEEIHKATMKGAMDAMFPFTKKLFNTAEKEIASPDSGSRE